MLCYVIYNTFHIVFTEAGVVLSKDLGQMQFSPAPGNRLLQTWFQKLEWPSGQDYHFFRAFQTVPTAKQKASILNQKPSASLSFLIIPTCPGMKDYSSSEKGVSFSQKHNPFLLSNPWAPLLYLNNSFSWLKAKQSLEKYFETPHLSTGDIQWADHYSFLWTACL